MAAMLEDPRASLLRVATESPVCWDVLVIGGGATGLSVAWDAVSRGLRVALVEQADFAEATSSRTTKLVHGGVRYLRNGEIGLVREALAERRLLLRNAPEFSRPLGFVLPVTNQRERLYYRFGMGLYDLLARDAGIGRSRLLSPADTLERLPALRMDNLVGAIAYNDAQFDDAALAVALAQAVNASGGLALNHAPVTRLLREGDRVIGAAVRDVETGRCWEMRSRVVINATGVFSGALRRENGLACRWDVRASRGSHLVCPREACPIDHALIIPETPDGRVLFAIPWKGHVVIGTTDVPVGSPVLDPHPDDDEVAFILREAGRSLGLVSSDITSRWAGLRPLVSRSGVRSTSALSRKHVIEQTAPGLVSVLGGKWTTARRMAEDAIDAAIRHQGLVASPSTTRDRPLTAHGARPPRRDLLDAPPDPGCLATPVVEDCRHAYARTLGDVLSRRLRVLPLDARKALELAPGVAAIMAGELGWDEAMVKTQLADFRETALACLPPGSG